MADHDDTFEKLEVWRRSHALSIDMYRHLASCRDGSFRDQVTRATNSIADNIAEGAERPGKGEFKQFLGYARGSAGESRSQTRRAIALGYIPPDIGGMIPAIA
jgi:four helix bundle protein